MTPRESRERFRDRVIAIFQSLGYIDGEFYFEVAGIRVVHATLFGREPRDSLFAYT